MTAKNFETYLYIAITDGDDSEAHGNARDEPPGAQPFAAYVAGNLKDDVLDGDVVMIHRDHCRIGQPKIRMKKIPLNMVTSNKVRRRAFYVPRDRSKSGQC